MFTKAIVILLLTSTSVLAQAEITHYVSLDGGVAGFADANNTTYDPGIALDLAYGIKIDQGFGLPARLEISAGYQASKIKEVGSLPSNETATLLSAFGNAYLDIPTGSFVTPYVMVGLGAGTMDYGADSTAAILFQLGLGAAFELSEHWMLDLKWQGFGTLDTKEYDISGAKVLLGARYMF